MFAKKGTYPATPRTVRAVRSGAKTYIVYVDGVERGTLKATSHNDAERKAKAKHPAGDVSVAYTEV